MLVVDDSAYGERVPVAIGTLHINMILDVATKEELEKVGRRWKRGGLGRKIAMKQNVLPAQDIPFNLESVTGGVKITKKHGNKTISYREVISTK